jgi:tRNA/tmRNA/rRNA uracil-C5-methylase (TrmA/RlmC/RlmD family)
VSASHEVGAVLDLTLIRPATGGAVARADDGVVVFVRHGLPGERVRATVTDLSRTYLRADVTEVIEGSDSRVDPACPHAGAQACGGCDLQHARRAEQVAWKEFVARDQLRRLAGLDVDLAVRDCGDGRGSRTRVRCAVIDGRLGFRRFRSHDVHEVSECWLADQRLLPGFAGTWADAAEVELRAIGVGSPFAVVRFERGSTVETRTLEGAPLDDAHSEVDVGDVRFAVGPTSFWQAHRDAPGILVDRVREFAEPEPGDHVVDLFGGVGLLGVSLAPHVGVRGVVTVVESDAAACRDAQTNAAGLDQVVVCHAPVSHRVLRETVPRGSTVLLDPPRTGVGEAAMSTLAVCRPRRVVYVSCDSATMARDLSVLLLAGYDLRAIEGYDLFPVTEHVELVAVLDERPRPGQASRKGSHPAGPR